MRMGIFRNSFHSFVNFRFNGVNTCLSSFAVFLRLQAYRKYSHQIYGLTFTCIHLVRGAVELF